MHAAVTNVWLTTPSEAESFIGRGVRYRKLKKAFAIKMISEYLHCELDEVVLGTVSRVCSRPKLGNSNSALQMYVNVAHCGELIALAFSREPVGVDVLPISDARGFDRLPLENYFSPIELMEIGLCLGSERDSTITSLWARKRALLKALDPKVEPLLKLIDVSERLATDSPEVSRNTDERLHDWYVTSQVVRYDVLSLATWSPPEFRIAGIPTGAADALLAVETQVDRHS